MTTTQTPAASARWTVLGTSDEITECDICGKVDLKGTVVLLDGDAEETGETYAGSDCAARLTGLRATAIRTDAARADRARRQAQIDAHAAWKAARSAAFGARRDAALGRDPGFAAIRAFMQSDAERAADAAWVAEHPEPADPFAGRR